MDEPLAPFTTFYGGKTMRTHLRSARASVRRYVSLFESTAHSKKGNPPTRIIAFLAKMAIKISDPDPNVCGCQKEVLTNDLDSYYHQNHRSINRDFYERIQKNHFLELRRILEEDPGGKMMDLDYSKKLLEHFLWSNPLKADWI